MNIELLKSENGLQLVTDGESESVTSESNALHLVLDRHSNELAAYRVKETELDEHGYTPDGVYGDDDWLNEVSKICDMPLELLLDELNAIGDSDWEQICMGL